jgi:cytoskeletal protein RodZ
MRQNILRVLALALVLLVAACSPAFPTIQPEAPAEQEADSSEALLTDTAFPDSATATSEFEPDAAAPTDTEAAAVDATEVEEEPAAPTDAPVSEECPYRPDLHATNPSTVSLGSGQVQVLEFFAFW